MSGLQAAAELTRPWRRAASSFLGRAWVWWILVVLWMAVIFTLSSQPRFSFVPLAWQSELASTVAHGMEYLILAVLLWQAVTRTPWLRERAAVVVLGAACLYAVSDEVHQFFVPGRVTDARDLLVDALGVALGVWLMSRRGSRLPGTEKRAD
jgi:VanZ family protein